jgi:hypothetical protein
MPAQAGIQWLYRWKLRLRADHFEKQRHWIPDRARYASLSGMTNGNHRTAEA